MAFACRKHKKIRCKPCTKDHHKAVEAALAVKGQLTVRTEPPKK